MSNAHAHDISKHVKVYIVVFLALLVGTIVTVAMNAVHFDNIAVTISVALFIALFVFAVTLLYMRAWTWGEGGYIMALLFGLLAAWYQQTNRSQIRSESGP